jgi:tRNA A37 threonylcarbamoyladenosine biosynthesis protein TsaE
LHPSLKSLIAIAARSHTHISRRVVAASEIELVGGRAMEAALVTVSTGVMKPLLSKLTDLLGEEYVKLKGVRKQIKFLRDELSAMSPTLDMLADAEQLDPNMREWRDKLRELAYDLEDCVDVFVVRVDHKRDGLSVLEWFSHELNKLKARHDLANQIEELKARVIETSDRHKRYDLTQLKNKPSSSSVDPRLQALYEDIDNLVGTDGPKKHIIDLLAMEANGSSAKLKVVSISGCGGLGKTTIAKQVYDDIKSQFQCAAFVSVSRIPDVRKILVHIADGVKCPSIITQDDDEQQLIDKLREHLHDKR